LDDANEVDPSAEMTKTIGELYHDIDKLNGETDELRSDIRTLEGYNDAASKERINLKERQIASKEDQITEKERQITAEKRRTQQGETIAFTAFLPHYTHSPFQASLRMERFVSSLVGVASWFVTAFTCWLFGWRWSTQFDAAYPDISADIYALIVLVLSHAIEFVGFEVGQLQRGNASTGDAAPRSAEQQPLRSPTTDEGKGR
jgi:hypothetical protein